MAIKINLMPKKEGSAIGEKPRRPFYFLIIFVIFIVSSLAYLGIYSYNTFVLKKQLDAVEKKTAEIQEGISRSATGEEFSAAAGAITKGKSIGSILSAHLYGSKIYELLEKLTIKSVSYNKFSEKIINDNTISISISGEAESFNAMAKQLVIFKKSKEIKEVIFKEATAGKNAKIAFSIILNIDSKLITVRPVIALIGPDSIEITAGSGYSDAGATAVDGIDGSLAVTTRGSVDANVAGTYILNYSAVNTAGNYATATRTVNVVMPKNETIPQ